MSHEPNKTEPWVAVVANPYSGSGPNRKLVDRLQAALGAHGLPSRALWDPAEHTAVLNDPDRQHTCRCVVAAGGDGTVGGVINETTAIPLAVLPMGNENLFAKKFGFKKPEPLAEAIARGRTRTIDLGAANERRFAVVASVGIDADTVERVQRWRVRSDHLKRVTRLSYARPIMSAALGYGYPPVELIADGRTVRGTHAMVFNFNRYAMGLSFTPDAECDDGKLHWVVFEKPGLAMFTTYLASVWLGSRHLKRKDVHVGTADKIELRCDTEAPVQVDGDPSNRTPVTIEALPQALRVIDTQP